MAACEIGRPNRAGGWAPHRRAGFEVDSGSCGGVGIDGVCIGGVEGGGGGRW